MDPLIVDSLAEAVFLILGGAVLGAGVYYFALTRISAPTRRRAERTAQLEAARVREVQRLVTMGPAFPRASAHLRRLAERADQAVVDLKAAEWSDAARAQRAIANMEDLARHCHELERVMRPRRRAARGL